MMHPEELTEADHAVRHWNAAFEVGTEVVRIDDHGHPHKTKTTSRAWVLPSGTAVVKIADMSGGFKLSRIWEIGVFNDCVEDFAGEGEEPALVS